MAAPRKKRLQRRRRRTQKKINRLPKGTRRRKRYKFKLKGILESIREWNEVLLRRKRQRRHIGTGSWGGSRSVARIGEKVIKRRGYTITSRKRWATFGNPSSDHWRGNPNAYALDAATANNRGLALEIAKAYGRDSVQDYQTFVYEAPNGRRFAVQIIYSTHGTGPHLHLGVHRI